eukprot:125555_1
MVSKKEKSFPVALACVEGGVAACVAELFTLPLDTVKVRLQIAGSNPLPGAAVRHGLVSTARGMLQEEGLLAMWKGLVPGLYRQMVFAGLRIGLYDHVRDYYSGYDPSNRNIGVRVAAGLTTGAFAICVAQPLDLIKIRIQAEGRLSPGAQPRYNKGVPRALAKVVSEEGIRGLWTGILPNIGRNSVINAGELATYDTFKSFFLDNNLLTDDMPCHILSGLLAGFVGTVVGSPFDVVKTRVMTSAVGSDGKPIFRGMLHCFAKTLRTEGPMAFYHGFIPNYLRIGTWNVVMFLTLEQIKKQTRVHFYPQAY